jgi:hypothetical protein
MHYCPGTGDSLTVVGGKYLSSNCDKVGNSKPVAIVLDAPMAHIKHLDRGGRLGPGVQTAIGAGPNLVSFNKTTGSSFVDIYGDNINIVEHASNTAVALRHDSMNEMHLLLGE